MTDLTNVSTRQLIDALQDRAGIEYIVNDRSSCDWAVAVDFQRTVKGSGEAIIIIAGGNY